MVDLGVLVRLLLEKRTCLLAGAQWHGDAVPEAVRRGYEHIVLLLLDSGAEINVEPMPGRCL